MIIYIGFLLILSGLFSLVGMYSEVKKAKAHSIKKQRAFYLFILFALMYFAGAVMLYFI